MGIFSNAQHAADEQRATTTVTTVTLLDEKGNPVRAGNLTVMDCPFVGFEGDSVLVQTSGPDVGWASRPLKPNQRAVRVVPLSDVAKMVFTDPT